MVGEPGVIVPTLFAMTSLGMQRTGANRLSRQDDFRYGNRARKSVRNPGAQSSERDEKAQVESLSQNEQQTREAVLASD
jgi:hypothetical protein